jgi:hypothetical protein
MHTNQNRLVAIYILEESISQLIITDKNQTPKPMPFFIFNRKNTPK